MSLKRFLHRRYWDEERARELEAYLEEETNDNIARGMPPEEARRAAHLKLGNTTRIREEIYRMNSLGWLETFWQDVRYAVRMLAKNPGATAVTVISLAIAIGPNCALFSVVDRLTLNPPAVQGVGQLFYMEVRTDRPGEWQFTSYPDLLDYQAQAGGAASFAALRNNAAVLDFSRQRQSVLMREVSENYFSVLGARAVAGRTLQESDAHFEGQPPAVISYTLSQRLFPGASGTVGKTILLNGRGFSLVGIMPRGFRGPGLDLPIDVWIPLSALSAGDRNALMRRGGREAVAMILVRLRQGVDKARAEAVLTAVTRRIAGQYPDTYKGTAVNLESPHNADALAAIVLSLAALVVLVACANIVGIRMTQGETRRQEFAVRIAMGASRGRLIRQLTAESLLLSAMAAGLGLLGAVGLIRSLPAFYPLWVFSLDFDFHVDCRVVAYALAITLITALAAGLAPSFQASRPDLVPTLKGNARTDVRRFCLRGALVIAQIATSQFLLVGAGLLFRSYQEVQRQRLGFDLDRKVLAAMLVAPTEDKTVDFARLAEKLREVPGVARVSFINSLPLSGMGGGKTGVLIPGITPEAVPVGRRFAGPGYFAVMGTQVLRGRDFDRSDVKGSVAINEIMARQFWGSPDAAIGRGFRMDGTDCRVVGVVENGKYDSLDENPMPFVFLAMPPGKSGHGTLLIETAATPTSMAGTIRKAIHDADSDAFLANLVSLRQSLQWSLLPYRLSAGLIGTIAVLGIFLAGVGLYGLVSYGVSRRTHEIGIRVAIGAQPTDVLALVFRGAASRLAIGVVIGLATALATAQIMKAALYRARVSPTDPMGLFAAVAAVAIVGLLATYVPARRALGVNPMNALREE